MVWSWKRQRIIIVNYRYTFFSTKTQQTQLIRERRNTIGIPCIIYVVVQPVLYSQKDIVQFSDFVMYCLLWEAAQELGWVLIASPAMHFLLELEQAT